MKLSLAFVAGLAGLTLVAARAQQMGSVNRNAPKISQTIEFDSGAKVSLNYTAITFAEGNFEKQLAPDSPGRTQMRDRINQSAKSRPLGTLETSVDLELSGNAVAAGEYGFAFMLSEDCKWQVALIQGEEMISFDLELADSPMPSGRLILSIIAGEGAEDAGIYLAFGGQTSEIRIAQAGSGGP
jgi:hypothetical protein